MTKKPQNTPEEIRDALEHRDVVMNVQAVLATTPGRVLFKYLFKSFDVAQAPISGLDGDMLHDHLGFLRSGTSIFKLACEANAETAASLLAEIEKERYAKIYADFNIGQG